MKPRHQLSRAAVDLIKRFEGYRMKAAQLPDGRWTIGYGHTLTARAGARVSEPDAEALLLYDLISVAHAVNELTFTPLTQNQFDALTCFAFNLGVEEFKLSDVLRRINEGALLQAACAMEMWRKADFEGERIVIDALVRRRSAEKNLFLTPPGGNWVPAPTPMLRP
ncbi:MAG: lysozyme, partial [Caulobacter sp.]|nr:lysozyme [Caulobacter sp.]